MSFEKSFCPSPWFHMRINNSGTYEYCRWENKTKDTRVNYSNNIQHQAPLEYFQKTLAPLRTALLNGQRPPGCSDCYHMEQHGKVSGRQKQLLKVGVWDPYFAKSLASSPLKSDFDYSQANQGLTTRSVTDWQIDLGNYCNGACVFCSPESSSRLASEFKKLKLIDRLPPPSWCDDPALLEQFITDLKSSTQLQYLHFIGGETVITPGFKKILSALVDADLAKDITIGFTTNLLTWDDELVEKLLPKFQQVNLGLSIETLTKVNEYVRYPSQLGSTIQLLERWIQVGKSHDWLIQLRTTPTCLTVHDLDSIYNYAWHHKISVESCNFLEEPEFMRISVLPTEHRIQARDRLAEWLKSHVAESSTQIINTRDPNIVHQQIYQDAQSYIDYLDTAPDESFRLPGLIDYLKRLESNRDNSILTYLPQYEELFRANGY